MATCPVCGATGFETGVLCPNGDAYLVRDKALEVDGKGLERHLGKVIGGRYAVVGYLGRGGMGVVYRAQDLKGSGEVALKLLLTDTPSVRARRRFLREAKVAARLRHPNIVETFGFGRVEDGFYLAMELIEGQPLSRYWRRGIPMDALLTVSREILGGLGAAHDAGVIHRDLKPGNILVGRTDGRLIVKVVDFGLARFSTPDRDDLTRTGELVGTPRYMSPQQARGSKEIDSTTDLYALGVILYEFVTGKLLFDAETPTAIAVMHITDPIPELVPRKGIEIVPGLEAVINKLLAKDPLSRYPSASAARAALSPFLGVEADVTSHSAQFPLQASEFGTGDEPPDLATEIISAEQDLARIRFKSRLVGRDAQSRELWELKLRALEERKGSVVVIDGVMGVGKTRLLEAFKEQVLEYLQMDWLEGASREAGGQSLLALRQVLSSLFGLRTENHQEAARIIRGTMARWGPAVDAEVEQLADLLRPSEEDPGLFAVERVGQDDSENRAERELLFGLIERVLRRAAAERPLVITLEDLHWAGSPTQHFLEYLIPGLHTTPSPILVVVTRRTDAPDNATWGELAKRMNRYEPSVFRRLTLQQLTSDEVRLLLAGMLIASEKLQAKILELSQGNPLYAIQMVRFLHDKEMIIQELGTWDLVASDELDGAVPPELGDLLLQRLKHVVINHSMGGDLMRLIERCALIGRQIPYDLLLQALRIEVEMQEFPARPLLDHLDEALDFLIAEGVLQENIESPDDLLEFGYGLLREVLRAGMRAKPTAGITHVATAHAKEAFYGADADGHAAEIARHYEAASDWDSALKWTVRAARNARNAWDLKSCEAHYQAAQDLMVKVDNPDGRLKRQVVQALGDLCYTGGRYDEAGALFMEAFELAEAAGDGEAMARLLFLRGDVARVLNDFRESESCYRECLAVAQALGARKDLGRALLGLSKLYRMCGQNEEALEFVTAAEEQFTAENDTWALADATRQRAYIFKLDGQFEAARVELKKALELHRQLDDKRGLAYIQRDLADIALLRNKYNDAQLQARKALDLFESIGARFGFAQTLSCLGEIHRAQGHYQAAGDLHAKALAIYEALNCTRDTASTMFNSGVIALKLGRPKEAREWFDKAHEHASLREFHEVEGLALAGLAWVAAEADDAATARTYLQHAGQRLGDELKLIADLADVYESCAKCFERAEEVELARATLRKAQAIWDGLGQRSEH
jgi:serine/threonine protein kinase/Tfp pilus assembly protein PilF